jgi:hypothetical protein
MLKLNNIISIITMYKIKIFSSFCSSELCKINFENVFNSKNYDFYGSNNKIYITTNDDYTHAIILNTAMPKLNIPKKNVIGLAFEPYELLNITIEFVEYAKKHIGTYLIGNKGNLPDPFIEHFSFMWHNNPNKEITMETKNNIMSIVLSEKTSAPGHQYRHLLVNEIIKENLPIDIYGRGSKNFINHIVKYSNTNTKIRGSFNGLEPYENYLFSICIENYESNDYLSEKILDPLLHNCHPIYLGAKNAKNYFKEIIILKGNLLFDVELLKVILKTPFKYYKTTYNERNLKRLGFFENIARFF